MWLQTLPHMEFQNDDFILIFMIQKHPDKVKIVYFSIFKKESYLQD